MSLASAFIAGSVVALGLVRQFLSNPSLTYVPVDSNGVSGAPKSVTYQVTTFREKLANQASKMLVIDIAQGKSFLNDNIAPMPRVWETEGFLFPLISITPDIDQIALETLKQVLRDASDSRQLVQFKPVVTSITAQFSQAYQSLANQTVTGTIPVVILDIEFNSDPLILNKAPVKITLQKIDTLSTSLAFGNALTNPATPDGTFDNPAASSASNAMGNVTNRPINAGGF